MTLQRKRLFDIDNIMSNSGNIFVGHVVYVGRFGRRCAGLRFSSVFRVSVQPRPVVGTRQSIVVEHEFRSIARHCFGFSKCFYMVII
jgi:hypothetical protein